MDKNYLLLTGYAAAFLIGATLVLNTAASITLYTVGKILGIWSLTALTFQLLLVTRMNVLDAAIGYDRITRWHAANGVLILMLVLLHPTLIFSRELLNLDFAAIINFTLNTSPVWLGELAILLIIFQAVSTVYWDSLDYEHWRILHRIGYLIVALGFLHSFLLGSDITLPPDNLVSVWWLTLAAVCVGSIAYRYGYRPLRKQQRFRITDVRREATDTYTVELLPETPEDDDIEHAPGQFAFVTFDSDDVPSEEHHFTLSSAPGRDGFAYTIKASGDFTEQIETLDEGDMAVVEGPYGRFTLDEPDGPLIMVAGGIGITPLMSMIRHMDNTEGVETHLFYGNRTVADIAFKEELDELEDRNDWLTVTHVLSDEEAKGYEHGLIDRDVLEDTDTDAQFYVCGPPPMMDAVTDTLRALGVPRSRMHTERFSLRDVNWRRLFGR